MKILILGATGFIGNAVFLSLVNKHTVTIASRKPIEGYDTWKKIDFLTENDWDNLLEGIDLVINAIGVIEGEIEQIQTSAPSHLYAKCIDKGCKIIHISAIGAEKNNPKTLFLKTKKQIDQLLLTYHKSKVIYPGIVIGKNGKSSQFFAELASFPIIPLLNNKPIPFIHVEQLITCIQEVVTDFENYPSQVFVISKPEPLKDVFSAIKGRKGRFIKISEWLVNLFFFIFPKASVGIFNKATYQLFQDSSVDDYIPLFPKVSEKIDPNQINKSDTLPQLLALLAISFIWIISGVSSLISWDESNNIMKEIGANHSLSILFVWLGSVVDIALGIAIFFKKFRKKVVLLQVITMLTYMFVLSIFAPHYWLHPFGVLTKNIPLLALSFYLYSKQT